jgi:hypothetical protein
LRAPTLKGRGVALSLVTLAGCYQQSHSVPEHPTWADVEPILRADCLQCHGGSAPITASAGNRIYRFDFFDLTADVCGEAAAAVDLPTFAAGSSALIANAITSIDRSVRPRMPPAPSPSLGDWEWRTLLRWTDNPSRGLAPTSNHPPVVQIRAETLFADKRWSIWAIVEDPDGEAAVGLLTVGDFQLKMDRPGAFIIDIDTSRWPAGEVPVHAVACDGWTNVDYALGTITVQHK